VEKSSGRVLWSATAAAMLGVVGGQQDHAVQEQRALGGIAVRLYRLHRGPSEAQHLLGPVPVRAVRRKEHRFVPRRPFIRSVGEVTLMRPGFDVVSVTWPLL